MCNRTKKCHTACSSISNATRRLLFEGNRSGLACRAGWFGGPVSLSSMICLARFVSTLYGVLFAFSIGSAVPKFATIADDNVD